MCFSSWSGSAVGLVHGPPTVGWFGFTPNLFPVRIVGGSDFTVKDELDWRSDMKLLVSDEVWL